MLNVVKGKLRATFLILTTTWLCAACGDGSLDITCTEYFKTTPSSLKTLSNGIVHDTTSNLYWYRCNAGQRYVDGKCKDDPLNLSFDATNTALKNLPEVSSPQVPDLDWRIPTQEEYTTLTAVPCHSPKIDVVAFPDAKSNTFYWSSSDGRNEDFACGTRLRDGVQFCQISPSSTNPTLLVANVE
ncbi:MAG: DUF1566 domain-containing protein [Pseudomonadota bacterium]|nr:DUF1566 domain-containing protein [Pseudomonadota bacterium]